ncbi:hypothetical protein KIF59_17250 [Enterobacter cloacae subsp. cloacae]|nr:hypothetical protein [Enterobacter cloacae subsp. cloacae]
MKLLIAIVITGRARWRYPPILTAPPRRQRRDALIQSGEYSLASSIQPPDKDGATLLSHQNNYGARCHRRSKPGG